ncbi:MAG: hypothetical protein ACW98Y_06925 [Candidatus Thorarchaeota archaeon]
MTIREESEQGKTRILASFHDKGYSPFIELEDTLWSWNKPILLWSHAVRNTTDLVLKDLRTYLVMDFDINGPKSYKDDMGKYDPETGYMTVWDEEHLYVKMSSRPLPDSWDISSPVKMIIDESHRDLKGTLEMGPRDIVVGLQWNLGDIQPGEKAEVDVVIASAEGLGEVRDLMQNAWDLFDKKMQ